MFCLRWTLGMSKSTALGIRKLKLFLFSRTRDGLENVPVRRQTMLAKLKPSP